MMKLDALITLLKTADSVEKIDAHREEIAQLIPATRSMIGYDQMNSAHQYDLWFHSLHTVMNLPREEESDMLYLAALLHDIGKPECRCKGTKAEDTNMHYYGHPAKSVQIVKDIVIPDFNKNGFYLPDEDVKLLLYYIEWHDDHVSLRLKHLRRHLKMADFNAFQNLMKLQVADAKAHVQIPMIAERVKICTELAGDKGRALYQRIQDGE